MEKYQYIVQIEVSNEVAEEVKDTLDRIIGNSLDNISFFTKKPEKIIYSEIKEIK